MKYIAIICVTSLIALSACSTPEPVTRTVVQTVERPQITIPRRPDAPSTREVKFGVLDKPAMQEKIADDKFTRIITIDDDQYRNLSYNIQETARYTKEQDLLIAYYEGTIRRLGEE